MPRYSEPAKLTPFAQVLVDYMWNRRSPSRPPMNVPQLATILGMPRQNVYNWIYRSTVPTFEIILAVFARLDIPLRDLYDAYQRAGMTVPRWDEHVSTTNAEPNQEQPAISLSRKPTAFQLDYDDGTPLLFPDTPPSLTRSDDDYAVEWQRLVDHTTAVMREAGISEPDIEATIARLRSSREGAARDWRFVTMPSQPSRDVADDSSEQRPDQKRQRKSTEDARK